MTFIGTLLLVPALFNLYLGLYGLFGPGVPLTQQKLIKGKIAKCIALSCLVISGVICNFVFG